MENKLKISENTVVHCKTEELAQQVLKIVDSLGYKWCDGDSYNISHWSAFGKDTCYDFYQGVTRCIDRIKHYEIISAQDFIDKHTYISDEMQENLERMTNDLTEYFDKKGIKESKGKKDYSEINLEILDLMADRFAANKHKYPKGNMKKPIDVKSLEWALFRHSKKMVQPIENDEESYIDHLSAILCNASMILDQLHNEETKS